MSVKFDPSGLCSDRSRIMVGTAIGVGFAPDPSTVRPVAADLAIG
jgi:hypothetical protein